MLWDEWDPDEAVAYAREETREEVLFELTALLKNGKTVDEAMDILRAGAAVTG